MLAQTLKRIVDEFGIDTLRNGKKTVSLFVDLAPQHKQEQTMLRYLIQCGGNTMLLDALNKSSGEQQVAKAKLIQKMMADCLVSQQAATAIVDSFWTAIGGSPIPTTNTAPGPERPPISRGSNNGQGNPQPGGKWNSFPKTARGGIIAAVILVILLVFASGKDLSGGQAANNSAQSSQVGAQGGKPKTTASATTQHVHSWKEATYNAPKTCTICGATEGSRLAANPIYLNELGVSYHEGKVWLRSKNAPSGSYHTNKDARSNNKNTPTCWGDWSIPGYTSGTVKDQSGNQYTYGIFIDGKDSQAYYMEFDLDGKYTTFSGTCACPDRDSAVSSYVYYNAGTLYSKYFEVYLDGKYIGSSPTMRADYSPQKFEFDISGGETLKILYPATGSPNEVASIYDGILR